MKRSVLLLAILSVSLGCQRAATRGCRVEDFGYHESYLGRRLVEQAIDQANVILDPALGLSFSPSWNKPKRDGRVIEVFMVDSADLPASDLARAPEHEDCLFLSSEMTNEIASLWGQEGEGTLEVDPTEALAVILLHEAGHFKFGDAGQYGDPVAINKDTLPVQLDEGKNKELRADRFAGDQIRSASKSSGQRQIAAMDMSLCLMNAGWNLLHHRLIDNFGATTLRLSSAFGDRNYSHPNLELRLLVINYAASHEPSALQLLQDFLDKRSRSESTDAVLFRLTSPTPPKRGQQPQ